MLLLFALMLSSAICAQDYHVVLWDNTTAPTSNGLSGDEVESKPGQWKNTQTAEMWIYKAGDNATGQALVFFPGGGYSSLSVGNGHKEAQWFARNGITAAGVKYRLPNGHSEVPRNDADEALRVMRSMAAELNIDPAKVGVSGTSAGGYLAGSVGTLSDVKPGFMILFYPVISADPDKRHKGTFVQLLGAEDADKPLAQEFSLEKKVDAATPPTLLFHCDDDKVVPAVNSALFYQKLKEHGIHDGILADLGCGTGELTLMLTQAGYDMIGIDQSEEMLCVVRDKAEQLGLSGRLLLLRQDLLKLDLYGTIRGAVSTFDTFNHIPDLDTAIANAGFFMEKGGVFLFDMNTPYKHRNVLGDNAFTFEEEDAACVWRNHYDAANRRVEITVDIDYHETGEHFHEQFCEYTYDLDTIRTALEKHGFALESVCDGETFGPLTEDSQRYFFCAVKQYTQLEG